MLVFRGVPPGSLTVRPLKIYRVQAKKTPNSSSQFLVSKLFDADCNIWILDEGRWMNIFHLTRELLVFCVFFSQVCVVSVSLWCSPQGIINGLTRKNSLGYFVLKAGS